MKILRGENGVCVIVFCDQSGETLRGAPTQLGKREGKRAEPRARSPFSSLVSSLFFFLSSKFRAIVSERLEQAKNFLAL